jgi:ABC-type transport system involved in multi-copper enzyme maturation permease subunit
MRAMGGEIDEMRAKQVLELIVSQLSYITAFIALNGIISNDRKAGYYRFLFSKPVSIPAYYAQQFIVFLVGYLIVNLVLLGIFALFAKPVSPVAPLAVCALVFLSFGGIAFLISSLFRYDWPILAAIFLGSSIFQSMWAAQEGWRRMVLSVLPPLHKVSGAMMDILRNGTMDGKTLLWLLGYSAICFAAGLFVLRRRPFA